MAELLTRCMRGMLLAGAAALLCWRLTVTAGVAAAVAGAFLGALLADRLEGSRQVSGGLRLRLASALLTAVAAAFLGLLAARWLASTAWIAETLGTAATLHLSEAVRWFSIAAPGIFGLHFLARRHPLAVLLEALLAGVAIADSLAAHRDAMIHRPLSIGDWALSRGLDPALIFLAFGGLAALLLSTLLVSEDRWRRLPLHFSALAVAALVLMIVIRVAGLPKPKPAGGLGLTGNPEVEGESPRPEDGDGASENELRDLEFRDDYGSGGEQAPVAVVILHDDYSPPAGTYYFRQSAFSQYNGHRLVQALREDLDRDLLHHFPSEELEMSDVPPATGGRRSLRTTMGLLVDHVQPFALDSPARVRSISNPDPLRFRRAFEVLSHVRTLPYQELLHHQAGRSDWTSEQWQHYLEAPSDPRYTELAESLLGSLRDAYRHDPLSQALTVKSYLDRNGIYSSRSRHADASDPVASFLFGDLTGYCVHFAHAATYLLRTLGLPTRVAAGYAVAESRRGNGSAIMIRGSDAHAWPELYLEDVGWVVIDLLPDQILDEPGDSADPDLQRMLGELMHQQLWPEIEPEASRFLPVDLAKAGRLLLIFLLGFAATAYLVKFYRSQLPRFASADQLYRVSYRTALDHLSEVGWRRRYGESRERFAERVSELAPAFADLTRQHLAIAFGSRRTADAGSLRRLLLRTREDLRNRTSWWRRLAGAANPISWILSR